MTRKRLRPATPAPWVAKPREWDAAVEFIATVCERIVVRMFDGRLHHYQLWEPVVGDAHYGVAGELDGTTWGLAKTRLADRTPMPDIRAEADACIEHEMKEARRAMDLLRRTVPELALRGAQGQYAGVSDGIFESRGDILVMGRPKVLAERVQTRQF